MDCSSVTGAYKSRAFSFVLTWDGHCTSPSDDQLSLFFEEF